MKYRDKILFGLPVMAAIVVVAFAALLYWQTSRFESAYINDATNNIALQGRLVSSIIAPMLNAGKIDAAIEFCNNFDRNALRLSLIDASGKVAADSAENPAFLDNHLHRTEIEAAFSGIPTSIIRYSESLNQWMLYHAIQLKTTHGNYVLRAAVSTDHASRVITLAKWNMLLALLLGGVSVLALALYIISRVRRPLLALQNAAADIANGKLDAHIIIPPGGMVRDLAIDISAMTEQLQTHLTRAKAERNEKNAILNTMSEAVLLFAASGDVIRYNRAAAALFCLPEHDARFNLARCGIPELLPAAHKTLQQGASFENEFILNRDGATLTLFIKGCILEESETATKRLLLTITDLTNLSRLESFRSDFVANVSHEIKTPLTCIIAAVEALLEEPSSSSEQTVKLLKILKNQCQRLNNLVEDILSLAALERQQLDPQRNFATVELDTMLINAVNLCLEKAKKTGIELAVIENQPASCSGDGQIMEQALLNLINNALKYSRSSKIEVSLSKQDNRAIIEVRDYGIGIAPEHQSRIFERFYRVHRERSRELGGTGLGLAIVKHIAQLHGGTAELANTPGGGCSFRIILPQSMSQP